jgi:hypothetical protein
MRSRRGSESNSETPAWVVTAKPARGVAMTVVSDVAAGFTSFQRAHAGGALQKM